MAGAFNAINKTNLIPKAGPGAAGFAVRKSDGRIITALDGTQRGLNTDNVVTLTANRTILPIESGTTFLLASTTSLVVTLPTPSVGLDFAFIVTVLPTDSGVGHLIAVTAGAKLNGKVSASGAAISPTAGKGVVNTYASQVLNDSYSVKTDGTDWFGKASGVWAKQS